MKIRGTDFVMFQVSNLAESARFYRDTLGLPQEIYSEEGRWAEFDCGDVTLALNSSATISAGGAGGRIALAVDDVPAAFAELKQQGVATVGEPVDYGVCCALELRDPDGNVVFLHHRTDGTFGRARRPAPN